MQWVNGQKSNPRKILKEFRTLRDREREVQRNWRKLKEPEGKLKEFRERKLTSECWKFGGSERERVGREGKKTREIFWGKKREDEVEVPDFFWNFRGLPKYLPYFASSNFQLFWLCDFGLLMMGCHSFFIIPLWLCYSFV